MSYVNFLFITEVNYNVKYFGKPDKNGNTHKWDFILIPLNNCEFDRVEFILHPTFAEPRKEFSQPPYKIMTFGYGTFDMTIKMTLMNQTFTEIYPIILYTSPPENHEVNYFVNCYRAKQKYYSKALQNGGIPVPDSFVTKESIEKLKQEMYENGPDILLQSQFKDLYQFVKYGTTTVAPRLPDIVRSPESNTKFKLKSQTKNKVEKHVKKILKHPKKKVVNSESSRKSQDSSDLSENDYKVSNKIQHRHDRFQKSSKSMNNSESDDDNEQRFIEKSQINKSDAVYSNPVPYGDETSSTSEEDRDKINSKKLKDIFDSDESIDIEKIKPHQKHNKINDRKRPLESESNSETEFHVVKKSKTMRENQVIKNSSDGIKENRFINKLTKDEIYKKNDERYDLKKVKMTREYDEQKRSHPNKEKNNEQGHDYSIQNRIANNEKKKNSKSMSDRNSVNEERYNRNCVMDDSQRVQNQENNNLNSKEMVSRQRDNVFKDKVFDSEKKKFEKRNYNLANEIFPENDSSVKNNTSARHSLINGENYKKDSLKEFRKTDFIGKNPHDEFKSRKDYVNVENNYNSNKSTDKYEGISQKESTNDKLKTSDVFLKRIPKKIDRNQNGEKKVHPTEFESSNINPSKDVTFKERSTEKGYGILSDKDQTSENSGRSCNVVDKKIKPVYDNKLTLPETNVNPKPSALNVNDDGDDVMKKKKISNKYDYILKKKSQVVEKSTVDKLQHDVDPKSNNEISFKNVDNVTKDFGANRTENDYGEHNGMRKNIEKISKYEHEKFDTKENEFNPVNNKNIFPNSKCQEMVTPDTGDSTTKSFLNKRGYDLKINRKSILDCNRESSDQPFHRNPMSKSEKVDDVTNNNYERKGNLQLKPLLLKKKEKITQINQSENSLLNIPGKHSDKEIETQRHVPESNDRVGNGKESDLLLTSKNKDDNECGKSGFFQEDLNGEEYQKSTNKVDNKSPLKILLPKQNILTNTGLVNQSIFDKIDDEKDVKYSEKEKLHNMKIPKRTVEKFDEEKSENKDVAKVIKKDEVVKKNWESNNRNRDSRKSDEKFHKNKRNRSRSNSYQRRGRRSSSNNKYSSKQKKYRNKYKRDDSNESQSRGTEHYSYKEYKRHKNMESLNDVNKRKDYNLSERGTFNKISDSSSRGESVPQTQNFDKPRESDLNCERYPEQNLKPFLPDLNFKPEDKNEPKIINHLDGDEMDISSEDEKPLCDADNNVKSKTKLYSKADFTFDSDNENSLNSQQKNDVKFDNVPDSVTSCEIKQKFVCDFNELVDDVMVPDTTKIIDQINDDTGARHKKSSFGCSDDFFDEVNPKEKLESLQLQCLEDENEDKNIISPPFSDSCKLVEEVQSTIMVSLIERMRMREELTTIEDEEFYKALHNLICASFSNLEPGLTYDGTHILFDMKSISNSLALAIRLLVDNFYARRYNLEY